MWYQLLDANLEKAYKKEYHPYADIKPIISLLRELKRKPYAPKLCAVTSLGRLRLTTAQSWKDDETKSHRIYIGMSEDQRLITASYIPPEEKKSNLTCVGDMDEILGFFDRVMIMIEREMEGK
jgi:hypothetical protein